MAAYGALVSVMQIMDQLHRHPHPPISLRKEHVESLTANLTFLQKFLEGYNPHRSYTSEADPLESRIAEAAYAAEDVIENYIVDQLQARSINHDGGKISSTQFYQGLEKVIQEMDVIKMEIVEKKMEGIRIIKKQSTTDDAADSSTSSSTAQKVTTMVGLDDALYEMLDKITGGVRARQIIPIVGMGGLVYLEDQEIMVIMLIAQWVAEGFVKPIDGKCLEEAAQEYLEELVDRNLVLVESRDRCGDVESIKIHDLLRDLALREGEKDKFLCTLKQSSGDMEISQGIVSGQRRIATSSKKEDTVVHEFVEAAATVRTLIGEFSAQILPISRFRLLRVSMVGLVENDAEYYDEILIRLLNLRFLTIDVNGHQLPKFSSYLWNLQTLILLEVDKDCVLEIWKMPLLRLVTTDVDKPLFLPDPPPYEEVIGLENLHALYGVMNLKLSEEVIKRIPNVRSLYLCYGHEGGEEEEEEDYYCVNNLHRLNKLQYLHLSIRYGWDPSPVQELILPYSLVLLTLENTKLPWKEMASKIGCLPLLQVLILKEDAFIGSEWKRVEGQFSSLKFLQIDECGDLEQWVTDDSTHFPRLEHLVLCLLTKLSEIPLCIGDIPMLRSIKVVGCSDSAVESARRIQEEQEQYDNQLLQIHIS